MESKTEAEAVSEKMKLKGYLVKLTGFDGILFQELDDAVHFAHQMSCGVRVDYECNSRGQLECKDSSGQFHTGVSIHFIAP